MTDLSNHNQPKEAYEEAANVLLRPIGYRIEFTGGISHVDQDTGDITVDPTKARLVKMEVVPPPVIQPPPVIDPTPPAGVRVIYVSHNGHDDNDGSQGSPIRSTEQVKRLIHPEMSGGSERNIWVGYERGGVYSAFGDAKSTQPDGQPNWQRQFIRGEDPDRPFVVFAYGEGPAPVFDVAYDQQFWWATAGGFVRVEGVRVQGKGKGFAVNGRVVDYEFRNVDFDGTKITVEGKNQDGAPRPENVRFVGSKIRNMIVPAGSSADTSGIFAARCDGLLIDGCIFDRVGWNLQADGSMTPDQRNHGAYLSGENGPTIVRNSIFTRCAGAGLQMRSGGVCESNFFADNGLAGLNIGWMRTGTVSSYPPAAVPITVRDVVIHHRGGVAMRVGNCAEGIVERVTVLSDNQDALQLDGLKNDHLNGLHNLTVRDSAIRSVRHAVVLCGEEWQNVKVGGNKLDGGETDIKPWVGADDGSIAPFADPNGGLTIGDNAHADLSAVENVTVTDEWLAPVLAGTTTATDLINQHKAH